MNSWSFSSYLMVFLAGINALFLPNKFSLAAVIACSLLSIIFALESFKGEKKEDEDVDTNP